MTDLVIRPIQPGEEELFLSLSDPGLVGVAPLLGRDYRTSLAAGEYRPEWTWVALQDGEVAARAAWWAGPDDPKPIALDWFDFTDAEAAEQLLRSAAFDAEFCVVLPAGWRGQAQVRHEAERRIKVAQRAGMELLVERLHYRWTPDDGLPERPGRLTWRPVPDDATLLDVLRRIHSDTLDAHARRALAERGPDAAAEDDMEFIRWMPSPREWLRLGYTASGDLVGLAAPGRNRHRPIIGLIGVAPEQRGHSYGYDLLVEATHILAAEGAEEIIADTDVGNVPMAKSFARAGYPIAQERVFLVWPADKSG
ncbi:MAG: GNAT family N-acetyltransferase [Micromonosporaceae bacterium]